MSDKACMHLPAFRAHPARSRGRGTAYRRCFPKQLVQYCKQRGKGFSLSLSPDPLETSTGDENMRNLSYVDYVRRRGLLLRCQDVPSLVNVLLLYLHHSVIPQRKRDGAREEQRQLLLRRAGKHVQQGSLHTGNDGSKRCNLVCRAPFATAAAAAVFTAAMCMCSINLCFRTASNTHGTYIEGTHLSLCERK